MTWLASAGRLLLLAAAALLVGWLYGYPLVTLVALLAAVIVFWLYQMHKIQAWLKHPDTPPPNTYGLWGELLARMYANQRSSKKVQEKLQANINYLQDSFTSMRDGVAMVDDSGALKWFNRALEPLLGLRYPDDTGRTLTNLVREPEFNGYFLSGDYGTPLQFVTGSGQPRHLRVEITYFGEGERLLFVRDVSEAIRLEKMRTDFVANVSHELRTPLTVITGYLSTFIANRQQLPDSYLKPLQQMSQQASRMENLLKDLLWLSRIENEKRHDKHELVDMCGLLQELEDDLGEVFPESCIELQLETDKRISGDYRELYSAMSNLLTNAIKYSPEGAPVRVRWYSTAKKCIVEVRDEGIGIDPVHIPRLTERFYRVDDSRSSVTGGTGLGLAIVKHVLAAHEGELQIESQLSKGSTFTLTFPEGGSHDHQARK